MVNAVNIPAALASSSEVAWLALLTITAADNPGVPLRVVNNSEPIYSRSMRFEPYPFSLTLPADDTDSLPSVTLEISNLDAAIVEFIRGQAKPPNIAIELITSAFPDFVEKSLTFLKLVSASYDAMVVTGRLDVVDFLTQKFPSSSYTPVEFIGLFR